MELLSKKIRVGHLNITIVVHDLSYRMGFAPGEEPSNHLYVTLSAADVLGTRMWSTPILTQQGKVKAYSTVSDAMADAERRINSTTEELMN